MSVIVRNSGKLMLLVFCLILVGALAFIIDTETLSDSGYSLGMSTFRLLCYIATMYYTPARKRRYLIPLILINELVTLLHYQGVIALW